MKALDYLLRNGNSALLSNLGVVLIDEIHMIDDEDRGTRLNGLIKRIKHLYPQFTDYWSYQLLLKILNF